MSFERPWLLLALAALPVLWLLARRAWSRRDVRVSSTLIWRRLGLSAEPPKETRRRSDLRLLLRLAAVALAVLGIAGLRGPAGSPDATLHVLLDVSASMSAFAEEAEAAVARIRAEAPEDTEVALRRSAGLRDLAALLAEAGGGDVVLVTDHRPEGYEDGGRVRLFLVGASVENFGLAAAWVEPEDEEYRFTAVVKNFGRLPRKVTVWCPEAAEPMLLAPGESRTATGRSTERQVRIRLTPSDRFGFDDAAVVAWEEGTRIRLRWVGMDSPDLRVALEVAGVAFDDGGPGELSCARAPSEATRLLFRPPGTSRTVDAGSLTVSGGFPVDALPPPGVRMGEAATLAEGGTVLLADSGGPLVVERDGRIEVAVDPSDPASHWSHDPSFPVFCWEVARRLGAREGRSVVLEGTIDHEESATRPESGRPDLTDLRPSNPARPASGASAGPLLFAAAAGLILLLVLTRGKKEA